MPEETARTNLRKALADLRPWAGDYLNIDYQTVSFRSERTVWVDVAEFAAKASHGSAQLESQSLQEAVDLYGGDFLAGFYELVRQYAAAKPVSKQPQFNHTSPG
jgi:DNA-binding SARP family transcriptional activator